MATPEIDPLTGQPTTGHEWDGIQELRTPIPTWWLVTFAVTWLFAIGCLVVFPSFATTRSFSPGLLGWSSKVELARADARARQGQAEWRQRLLTTPLEDIEKDPALRRFALAGGQAAFNENCAACHGVGGGGQIGQFPALVDDDWLWGGRISEIGQTLRHGIRSQDDAARQSEMPAFGEILSPSEIESVADYVLTLPNPAAAGTRSAMPGAAIFAANCSSCHGERGQGGRPIGAPRLDDHIWLYGSSRAAIVHQVTTPRMGVMPAFGDRLDEDTQRMLAVYVHNLGGGER